jgi:hypothetical protein
MTMLDLDRLDLGELCMALEDNSPEHAWWLDPRTGELEPWSELGDNDDEKYPVSRDTAGLVPLPRRADGAARDRVA